MKIFVKFLHLINPWCNFNPKIFEEIPALLLIQTDKQTTQSVVEYSLFDIFFISFTNTHSLMTMIYKYSNHCKIYTSKL